MENEHMKKYKLKLITKLMKSVKFLLAAVAMFVGFSASAQDFSDDKVYGKWGATVEERQENILASISLSRI